MHIIKIIRSYVILFIFVFNTNFSHANEWELGVGLAVLDIPLYSGSSQNKTFLLPVPHLFYQSDKLLIDNGIEATFANSKHIRFNLSADLSAPVDSKDSNARAGMPDLNPVVQIGPSLEITLAGGRFKPSLLKFELPIRAALATDFRSLESIGWIFEPRLSYETRRPHKTGFAHQVSSGLRFSTAELHQYYYGVEQMFATPNRSQYVTSSGYSGLFVDYVANWRTKNFIFFALLRYQNISATAFEDSPLVQQNDYLLIGTGITWLFARNL